VLRRAQGREAVGLPADEEFVGLLHLGEPVQEQRTPERIPAAETVEYLD
jgi:nitroreductase